MHARAILRTRLFHYTAVAVIAFTIGSASVVLAASSGAVQLPAFRLGDGTNPNQYAKVNADGSLEVSVSNQPSTQQVSGTVSVSNFPSTQNVNVTAGTVVTKPSVATRGIDEFFGPLGHGESDSATFTPVKASYINVTSISGDIEVEIHGTVGRVFRAFLGDNEVHAITLTQQIPVDTIEVHCTNVLLDCAAEIYIFGD